MNHSKLISTLLPAGLTFMASAIPLAMLAHSPQPTTFEVLAGVAVAGVTFYAGIAFAYGWALVNFANRARD